MAEKHAWNLLVDLSGDSADDYKAIQPVLQQVILNGSTKVEMTKYGPVVVKTLVVNGQTVIVKGREISEALFVITDAWIKTR